MRKLDILLLMGVEAVLLCAGVAVASRNSSGTMAAINGPYVAGTTISSATVNARLADIESEITDSLSRSGKGGMSAALRGTDGTKAAPALSFTSETGSGLYRNGAADVRMSVTATDVGKWTASGAIFPAGIAADTTINSGFHLGIGGAPTNMLDLTVSGSASTTVGQWLEASLADGNSLTTYYGKSLGSGLAGILTYTKNATAANSKLCLGVFGGAVDTACVDGNNKFYIGTSGTGISIMYKGVCTLNAGTPAQCTQTVPAAAIHCTCSVDNVTTVASCATSVTATTLTVTATNGLAAEAFAVCTN